MSLETPHGNQDRTAGETRCLECNRVLAPDEDRENTPDGSFCRSCFNTLRDQIHAAVRAQGSGVNYGAAALGGVIGGILGAMLWWGFTVVTKISFGLVAVVIGFAVGQGIRMTTGGKRSRALQVLGALIALIAYFYATFLVNRTFILRQLADRNLTIPFFPDPVLMYRVISAGFGIFDLVFLAIVVWQAWKMNAPFRLGS